MPRKKPTTSKANSTKPVGGSRVRKQAPRRPVRPPVDAEMLELLKKKRLERVGPNATFEQQSDADFEIMRELLWKSEDERLLDQVTDADEIDVDGKKFRRMQQASSAKYFGRFGAHHVEEPLYRAVGVRNGPTIKPIEFRVGVVEHMLPDMARIVGALSADDSSRALERTLRTVGHVSPSRAFLQDHVTLLGDDIADVAADLEEAARDVDGPPSGIASVSCGMDRMSVRMSEIVDGTTLARDAPYERTPPPQKAHHYRKAWVGSVTAYDVAGAELHTWRLAAEADADPAVLAKRVAADVAWIVDANPCVPVHCVQDAAPELGVLPASLARALPADVHVVELVDFEHLMGYLDDVVDACDPEDEHDMKSWYRNTLLSDDNGIDRIQQNLRRQAKRLRHDDEGARNALAAALRYMRKRKSKMRYASLYQQDLPIGSGATESGCWQMQQRVKLPGQSWEPTGLRGVLAIRALVLSDRWDSSWSHYAELHRAEVSISA